MVRTGLRMILSSQPDFDVVAEASDGDEVVRAVQAHRPDVVLMDLCMARLSGIEATRAVVALPGAPAVVVLTNIESESDVLRALEAGARGFVLKDAAPTEIVQGVRVVAGGDSVLSPRVARYVVSRVARLGESEAAHVARRRLACLTERERQIAVGVRDGLNNAEIGARLYCSEATVKTHLSRAMTKLDLRNRVQLALLAQQAGLTA